MPDRLQRSCQQSRAQHSASLDPHRSDLSTSLLVIRTTRKASAMGQFRVAPTPRKTQQGTTMKSTMENGGEG